MKKLINLFNWKKEDIFKVLLGSLLYSISVNIFIVPNNLYTGGILGLSQLIRTFIIDIFKLNISFDFSGILYYLINIPLFFIAYKNISKPFFVRTLFAVTIQSILLSIIPTTPIISDILTNVLVGGFLGGIGIGLTLSCGASTGGTDIIGLAAAKKNNNLSVGKLGLIVNIFIYGITGIMYGLEIMIYSIISSIAESLMIDKMHNQNICSTAFIFTKKRPDSVNNFIKNELQRDFTYWEAFGGYDDSRTYIIYTALTKYELIRLEKRLHQFDDHAFMVKSEGVGIKGEFTKSF